MNRLVRRIIVAMLLGVAVYGAIVLYRGVGSVAARFETYAFWTFGVACALSFSNYVLRFLKWEYYLALLGIRGIPKGESFLVFLSGFVLTVTPGKVGEVFKSVILQKLRGVPVARTAPIVVAERVTDLIGIIILIAIGSASFPGGAVWASAGTVVVVLLLAIVAWPRLSNALLAPLPRLPGGAGRLFARIVPRVTEALGELRTLTTPLRLIPPAALSVVSWSLEGIALWIILSGFGENARLVPTAFFYATATLAGALVPVPGGLGVTDKLLEEQMAHIGGVAAPVATAAMLLGRFATLWFAVVVGFAALFILRLRYPSLASTSPEDAPEARDLAVERATESAKIAGSELPPEKTP